MKILYKYLLIFGSLLVVNSKLSAQIANCDDFCVTDIQIDTINTNSLLVSVYMGDTSVTHINYPFIDLIIDNNGDTIASDVSFEFYTHFPNTNQTYKVPTVLNLIPVNFSCSVKLVYHTFSPDETACVLPFPCTNELTATKGLDTKSRQVKIYPNPASQHIALEFFNSEKAIYSLTLYDTNQHLVKTITGITNNKVIVERENLRSGLYLFELVTSGQVPITGKLTFN
tara:strand:+ start:576 stop:1256 length:681 start_codon:yes stop_codon:yes gene_type:complete